MRYLSHVDEYLTLKYKYKYKYQVLHLCFFVGHLEIFSSAQGFTPEPEMAAANKVLNTADGVSYFWWEHTNTLYMAVR